MSETVRIDLSPVIDGLNAVNRNVIDAHNKIVVVGTMVEAVAQEQADTKQRLEQLYEEFLDYREKDEWANEVSKARQEITIIRQEIEKQFGHHDTVRRHAKGILQALDAGIVREETIRSVVEGHTMDCPGYWLAP